eukprot:900663-Heterocapsa_arctica.AAC.1
MKAEQTRLKALEQEQMANNTKQEALCKAQELQILRLEKLKLNPKPLEGESGHVVGPGRAMGDAQVRINTSFTPGRCSPLVPHKGIKCSQRYPLGAVNPGIDQTMGNCHDPISTGGSEEGRTDDCAPFQFTTQS